MNRRGLLVTVLGLFLCSVAPAPASAQAVDTKSAATFVAAMVDEFFGTLAGKTLTRDERSRFLDGLMHRYADVQKTSEELIGRSWSRASESEQALFQQTLVAYMLALWSGSVNEITPGQKIVVTGAEPHGDFALVRSIATCPGEDTSHVEWLIGRGVNNQLFVADVAVDGVSMIRVMKSDFSSVLFANSGRLGSLIAGMQKKIQAVN